MFEELDKLLCNCADLLNKNTSDQYYIRTVSKYFRSIEHTEDIKVAKDFIANLLRLCALAKLQNRDYFSVFFDSDLALPSNCSKEVRKILKCIAVHFMEVNHNRWFHITIMSIPGSALDVELGFWDSSKVTNCYRNYLQGTPDKDLVQLLSWSLQWITSYSIRIVPDYASNTSLQNAWVKYIDKNLIAVDRRIKALQDMYSGTYTLSLKFHEIDANTKFYTLDCSMSDTV